MEIFFFRIRLWECVYKQINSVIYFGQKKGEGDGMEWKEKWESEDFSQRSYNGIERGREREMEETKDITRSYTNFIMYPYQCIYS